MEPLTSVVDKLKSLAKSGEDFISGLVHGRKNASRRNPMEILKRLQRESFSDLMKLRDRQDKVERALSFYRTSSFKDEGTRVKGEVDLLGSLVLIDDLQSQTSDDLSRSGIRTGIMSRITFETTVREKDTAVMEFVTNQQNPGFVDDTSGSALSIAKIAYTANVSDWLSMIAIPIGGRCRDFASSAQHEKGLTEFSSCVGPPLLNSLNGSAIGITARKSNVIASLAQLDYLSSFGEIVCQLHKSTKISLLGLHQSAKLGQPRNRGALTIQIPVGLLKWRKSVDTDIEAYAEGSSERTSTRSVAVMMESELDEDFRFQGWVQMKDSNPRCVQWAMGLSDSPEDAVGYGLSLGGMVNDHFQVEAFMKLKMGKRFNLQPGVVYVMNGPNRYPRIMCRASWCL